MAGGRRKDGARREPVSDAESKTTSARGKKGSPRKRSKTKRSSFVRVVYWSLVVLLWVAIESVGGVAWIGAHLPPIQSLDIPKRPPSIQIVGTDGRVLTTRGDGGGAAMSLKELPPYLPKAFMAIEDRRFYAHHGVD